LTEGIELNAQGPHSPGYTRDVAASTAECLRVLNAATKTGAGGIESPEDIYDVLGALHFAALRLPQLFDQLGNFLQDKDNHGLLDTDANTSVAAVVEALQRANDDAIALAAALETAWSSSNGISERDT
jgi:hypothetical protein